MQDALRKHECNLKGHHEHACTILIHTLYKKYKLKRIFIEIRDQTNILYYIEDYNINRIAVIVL